MLYSIAQGGKYGNGVIFNFDTRSEVFSKLIDIPHDSLGRLLYGGLLLADDGLFYGSTYWGGANNDGVIFRFNPNDTSYTKLYDFEHSVSGSKPQGGLMQASNGKLYGMTSGGSNGWGYIFEFDPEAQNLENLHPLSEGYGYSPESRMLEASEGELFGTFPAGGIGSGLGVLFQYSISDHVYEVLYEFGSPIGYNPEGTLTLTTEGKLLGSVGEQYHNGGIFEYDTLIREISLL